MSVALRSQALTVLAPLVRGGVWRSRLTLPIVRLLAPSSALARLRFIHFAQWSAFRSLPGNGSSGRRRGLLFVVDFDGDMREYLAAFGIATPHGMRWAFGGSKGFPGPRPTRKLIDHVEAHRRVDLLRYCAYPGTTVKDVDAAVDVANHLDRLQALDGAHDHDRLMRATAAVVEALGHAPEQDVPTKWSGALAALRARPTVSVLTVATPVADTTPRGHARCRQVIEGFDADAAFDRIGGTHFSRVSTLGDHLLFSAFVDGTPDAYVDRLVAGLGSESDQLWSGCTGYPGHADVERLTSWVSAHRLPTSLFLPGRSGMSVDGIRRALARRGRAMDVVTSTPGASLLELGERLQGV